ncbi:MAG: hypothetical protein R2865_12995 [Deinococcales bacterium]
MAERFVEVEFDWGMGDPSGVKRYRVESRAFGEMAGSFWGIL